MSGELSDHLKDAKLITDKRHPIIEQKWEAVKKIIQSWGKS